MDKTKSSQIPSFEGFKALDGYHCQTSSLMKIFVFNNCPISEDMLLGIGSGYGFIYWAMKGQIPFVGGRDNSKNFFNDISKRTGVKIEQHTTSSLSKAEKTLIEMLERKEPVMFFADMAYLPCFDMGGDWHFGGHTSVICGWDEDKAVLVSDMEPSTTGLKKGFFYELSLEQLAKARNSKFKPFPPKNAYFTFDFSDFHHPTESDIYNAIKQTLKTLLEPPIKNLGIKGIRKAAIEIKKWEKIFDDEFLRGSIFNFYVFVHIGGTGGGIFRYMYSRFLKEVSEITSNKKFIEVSDLLKECGDMWTELVLPMKDVVEHKNPAELLKDAPEKLNAIANIEEKAYTILKDCIV